MLRDVEDSVKNKVQQTSIAITMNYVKSRTWKTANRKSSAQTRSRDFWLKRLTEVRERIVKYFKQCVTDCTVSDCMATG